jgi:hypothetical protein
MITVSRNKQNPCSHGIYIVEKEDRWQTGKKSKQNNARTMRSVEI